RSCARTTHAKERSKNARLPTGYALSRRERGELGCSASPLLRQPPPIADDARLRRPLLRPGQRLSGGIDLVVVAGPFSTKWGRGRRRRRMGCGEQDRDDEGSRRHLCNRAGVEAADHTPSGRLRRPPSPASWGRRTRKSRSVHAGPTGEGARSPARGCSRALPTAMNERRELQAERVLWRLLSEA